MKSGVILRFYCKELGFKIFSGQKDILCTQILTQNPIQQIEFWKNISWIVYLLA